MNNTITHATPMFTHHGEKRKQGYPIKIHGQNAIGYFEKEQLIGYTTLDEIHQMFYGRNIPEFEIDENSSCLAKAFRPAM